MIPLRNSQGELTMNAGEIVRMLYSSLEAKEFDTAQSMLTDDFTFSGATPQPLNKHQWIGVIRAMKDAMPDWSFNYKGVSTDGDYVEGTVAITGTQTGTLNLPMPGMQPIPATGKHVAGPKEKVELTVRGEQVASLTVENVPGGGVPGIVAQLNA